MLALDLNEDVIEPTQMEQKSYDPNGATLTQPNRLKKGSVRKTIFVSLDAGISFIEHARAIRSLGWWCTRERGERCSTDDVAAGSTRGPTGDTTGGSTEVHSSALGARDGGRSFRGDFFPPIALFRTGIVQMF